MNSYFKKTYQSIKKRYKCWMASVILLIIPLTIFIGDNVLSEEQKLKVGAFLGSYNDKLTLIWKDCKNTPLSLFKSYAYTAYLKTRNLYKSGELNDISDIRNDIFYYLFEPDTLCSLQDTQYSKYHQNKILDIVNEITPTIFSIVEVDNIKNWTNKKYEPHKNIKILANLIKYYNYFALHSSVDDLLHNTLNYCKDNDECEELGRNLAECFTKVLTDSSYCNNKDILFLKSTHELYSYLHEKDPKNSMYEYMFTLTKILHHSINKDDGALDLLLKTGEMRSLAEKGNEYAMALIGFNGYSYKELKNFYDRTYSHLILELIAKKWIINVDRDFKKHSIKVICKSENSYFCDKNLSDIYFEEKEYNQARIIYEDMLSRYRPEILSHQAFNLGLIYQHGAEVRQNNQKALEYFGIACDHGNKEACYKYKEVNEKLSTNNN